VRRSRLDIAFGRVLTIGQLWAERGHDDERPWRVRQVHRFDCSAELERGVGRRSVSFEDLRKKWQPADEAIAA
jgi:hypothetical protein